MRFDDVDEQFIEKSKHKGLKIFFVLLLIIGLAYGGYYYYVNYYNNPVEKINTVITSLEDKLNERLQTSLNISNKAHRVNGLIKVNINSNKSNDKYEELSKIFNNLNLQINGEIDHKNNIANLNLSSKINNQKLINGKIYTENKKIFVQSEEIFDKFIFLGDNMQNNFDISSIEISDLTTVYNIAISTFIKNLDTKNAKKEDEIVKINGVNTTANKYGIVLNNEDIFYAIKNITKDLKSNNTFVSTMNKISKDWEKVYDKEFGIPEDQEYTTNEYSSNLLYEINFYTTKDIMNEKLIKISQSYKINQSYQNREFVLTMEVDFMDDDSYLITIGNDDKKIYINLTLNNNKFNIEYNDDDNDTKINIVANFNYEEISTIQKENISNSISIEDLSEDEKQIIDDNMKKNDTLIDFLHNIRDYLDYGIN